MMANARWLLAAAALSTALLTSPPLGATKAIGTTGDPFTLTSAKFDHQSEIPVQYTCDGADASPPLAWEGEPPKTQSLVLVMEDPDASESSVREPTRRSWTHWIVYNIPPIVHALHESVRARRDLPHGAREGVNDSERVGYSGPCPVPGRKHHYLFKLFALDMALDLETPGKLDLEREMQGHILARAELIGTYERKK